MLAAIQAAGFGGNELHVLVACATPKTGQMGQMRVPLIEQTMTGHNPGATPLYAAACGGSTRCASLLCKAGAKIDARTQNDASPLLVSCQVRARQRTAPQRTAPAQQPSSPEVPPRHSSRFHSKPALLHRPRRRTGTRAWPCFSRPMARLATSSARPFLASTPALLPHLPPPTPRCSPSLSTTNITFIPAPTPES